MRKVISYIMVLVVSLSVWTMVFADEIHEAAKSGDVEKVKELIEKNPDLMYVKDEQGKTPLHWATGRGQLEVIRLLIGHNVNINVRNNNGGTPLHVAASQAQPEAAQLLINHGADVNARTKDQATPLHFAALKMRKGHLEAAKILLKNNANVDAKMNNGATALSMAIMRNNTEMVELLRRYGAKEEQALRRTRFRMRED